MYCSKCGANVPDGAVFCSACGQPTGGVAAGQPAAAGPAPPVAATAGYPAPVQAGWQAAAARPAVAYAGFWLRLVAVIIDAIVLGFVRWIVFLPFAASMGLGMHGIFMGHPPSRPEELFPMFGMLLRLWMVLTVLNWLYFSLFESSGWQATLGKKALGLEVTDLAGRRISFGRATGRFFGKYISAIILFIGFIMAGFTEKKQALHDILAGTLVIRKL
jgi:uncharacterized RDD family membrane protein YckC